jgi:ketosteroid isomerase-like protein
MRARAWGRPIRCAALLLLAAGTAGAQGLVSSVEARQLIDLDRQVWKAMQTKDRAALDQLLAPDFGLTALVEGYSLLKKTRADAMGLKQDIRAWYFHESDVRLLGDTALVASRVAMESKLADGADRSGEFLVVDAWRRSGSSWRLAARYSSRAEPAPK